VKNLLQHTFLASLILFKIVNSSDCDSPLDNITPLNVAQDHRYQIYKEREVYRAQQLAREPIAREATVCTVAPVVLVPPKELTLLHKVVNSDNQDLVETALLLIRGEVDDDFVKKSGIGVLSVDDEDKYGITSLHIAVIRNQTDLVKALLRKKHSQKNLNVALHYAQSKSNREIREALLDAGAQINSQVSPRCSLFCVAVRIGHKKTIDELIAQGVDLNAEDHEHYMLALNYAIEQENLEVIRTLLKYGAKTDIGFGCVTALSYAVKHNKLASVKTLLKAGVAIDAKGSHGQTALVTGIIEGSQLSVIETLIRSGTDVNIRDDQRLTALYYALISGNIDYVRVLLAAGANPNLKLFMYSPLNHAIREKEIELVKMLVVAKADVNDPRAMMSPLEAAISSDRADRVDRVRYLLSVGAKPDQRKNSSELMLAVQKNNLEMVEMLVEAGANVNTPCEHCSILYAAKVKNNPAMVAYLVSKGAKLNWLEWWV
jgi:ankyrin repeat protein